MVQCESTRRMYARCMRVRMAMMSHMRDWIALKLIFEVCVLVHMHLCVCALSYIHQRRVNGTTCTHRQTHKHTHTHTHTHTTPGNAKAKEAEMREAIDKSGKTIMGRPAQIASPPVEHHAINRHACTCAMYAEVTTCLVCSLCLPLPLTLRLSIPL